MLALQEFEGSYFDDEGNLIDGWLGGSFCGLTDDDFSETFHNGK